jgi:hypothetical protein
MPREVTLDPVVGGPDAASATQATHTWQILDGENVAVRPQESGPGTGLMPRCFR